MDNVTTDTVVEQSVLSYDAADRVWLTTSYQRNHDGSGTGALTTSNARITYAVTWWDDLGRTKWAASYGTNDGTAITDKTYDFDGAGAGSDYATAVMASGTTNYILTYFEYDSYGRNHQTTDNAGHKTRTFFDDGGRVTHRVENYDDFDPDYEATTSGDAAYHDKDRVTKFTYVDCTSMLKEQIALDVSGDGTTTPNEDQVTRYVYAIELTDQSYHPVISGGRLRAVIYPDSADDAFTGTPASPGSLDSTSPDHIEVTYYADGSVYTRMDQRGTIHTYVYDDLSRLTKDRVTTLGGADDFVQSITYAYDDLGRSTTVKSFSGNDGSGTCRNTVEFAYNDIGLLSEEYQEHEGDKDGNTLCVRYNYDDTVSSNKYTNGMRPKSFRYPSYSSSKYTRTAGSVVARLAHWTYDAADSNADRLSRIDAIEDDPDGDGTPDATPLAVYSYNGTGTIVIEDYQQPDVKLDYFGGTSGTYAGLDRFGRVIQQQWYDYGASETRDRYDYTYDANSNRTSRDNTLTTGKDEKYTYDNLDRLTSYDRGTLSGGDITSKVRNEAWTLSQTGNWGEFKIDADGDGNYDDAGDLDQNRAHNDVNELTGITEDFGASWADPAHDAAGNMTTVPKPTDMTATYTCTYDAWNRLCEVSSGETVVGRYEYDGLNRRIKKHIDTQAPIAPDGVDTYRHFFYDSSWRIVETRSTTSDPDTQPETLQPEYQYVWSLRYIDAPILRDKNTDDDDLCDDQSLYYLADANMNVTALVDTGGDALERYTYDPYGNLNVLNADWSAGTIAYDNSILYCGYYRDSETGLYHVRHRYHHPNLGRFITHDPLGYVDGMSLYEYCSSGPTGLIDPFGLKDKEYTIDITVPKGTAKWRGKTIASVAKAKLEVVVVVDTETGQGRIKKVTIEGKMYHKERQAFVPAQVEGPIVLKWADPRPKNNAGLKIHGSVADANKAKIDTGKLVKALATIGDFKADIILDLKRDNQKVGYLKVKPFDAANKSKNCVKIRFWLEASMKVSYNITEQKQYRHWWSALLPDPRGGKLPVRVTDFVDRIQANPVVAGGDSEAVKPKKVCNYGEHQLMDINQKYGKSSVLKDPVTKNIAYYKKKGN